MRSVLVPVKRVIDYAVKVRVRPDRAAVDLQSVKMSLNPFCEIAVEEARKLKEAGTAEEVVAVSIGAKDTEQTLRTALAMGCDRAVHITTDLRTDQELQPLAVARLLEQIVRREDSSLVLMGKQSIDGDNCQTGPMLAALLGWPQATFAATLRVDGAEIEVDRETDAGTELVRLGLPAVVTTDLRLNEPRYATLPNIVKAKKKPLEKIEASSLVADLAPRNLVLEVNEPEARQAGVLVESVDELVDKLKNEAGVV